MPAALEKGRELSSDQTAGAGHPDAQPRLAAMGRVAREVGQCAFVAKTKETLEEPLGRQAAEQIAGGAERQAELDVVLDHAPPGTVGDEGVGVLPLLERAVELTVAEPPTGHGVAVQRHPAAPQRTVAVLEDQRATVLHVAAALDHAGHMPGRAQAFERARPHMPGVDLVG